MPNQTFIIQQEVRSSTVRDAVVCKSDVQLVGRGRQYEGQPLLTAADRYVALVSPRLAQQRVLYTSCTSLRCGSRSRRL